MKFAHSKIVAKIQHFYDVITIERQRNEDAFMLSDNTKEKEYKRCAAECYTAVGKSFDEIFRDVLYHCDESDDD